jgi:hypothetical protein
VHGEAASTQRSVFWEPCPEDKPQGKTSYDSTGIRMSIFLEAVGSPLFKVSICANAHLYMIWFHNPEQDVVGTYSICFTDGWFQFSFELTDDEQFGPFHNHLWDGCVSPIPR